MGARHVAEVLVQVLVERKSRRDVV